MTPEERTIKSLRRRIARLEDEIRDITSVDSSDGCIVSRFREDADLTTPLLRNVHGLKNPRKKKNG